MEQKVYYLPPKKKVTPSQTNQHQKWVSSVVYFYQLLGAARNRKLIKITRFQFLEEKNLLKNCDFNDSLKLVDTKNLIYTLKGYLIFKLFS